MSTDTQVDIPIAEAVAPVILRSRQSCWPAVPMPEAISVVEETFTKSLACLQTIQKSIKVENIQLGYVLATNVIAKWPHPPFRSSIKDGYAVLASDGAGPRKVISTSIAEKAKITLKVYSGVCCRINTGAALPAGSDAVVQVEDTTLLEHNNVEESTILIAKQPKVGQDIREIGSDVALGELLLEAGCPLQPADLGLLALSNWAEVDVYKKAKVAVMSTGDELTDHLISETEKEGGCAAIRDTNRPFLLSLFKSIGAQVHDMGITCDNKDEIINAMKKSFEVSDILVVTGGVSMGEKVTSFLLQHAHLPSYATQPQKLKEKFGTDFHCPHSILFSTMLAMDKNTNCLATLYNCNLSFTNLDAHGQTLLHWAVKRKSFAYIQEFLQIVKLDVQKWILLKDKRGITPLHLAAQHESTKILKFLLTELGPKNLFSLTQDNNGQSPLHYAAASASLDACELLMDGQWGLPLDQRDSFGQTPLMYGCSNVFFNGELVVRLLASKKTITVAMRNKRGMTAFHIAVLANNLPALKVLLNDLKFNPTVFDNENRTPLHYAALFGRTEVADLLLQAGANNQTRDVHSVTAAHYAAQAGHFDTLYCILQASESRDVLDSDCRSCLMWAVIAGREEVVDKLLAQKTICLLPKTHKDRKQLTTLHLAALVGNKGICKLLVDHGYSPMERDAFEATPEHLAAGQGHIDALTYFAFNKGWPGPPLLDCMGRTSLFYACLGGQAHAVEVMSKGQSPSLDTKQVDYSGQTAIHCAVLASSLPCIKVLLQYSYDPNVVDHNGKTALDLAVSKGNQEIIRYLSERTKPR